ncbi:hemolysin III family protein [bacterium]|nr:MAG: hemolysin III family protein [candidate division KSB1 bacterium]MCE7944491.1 hemolysin III family protein [Chlorobi bacterium CHB1]MCL4708193.1 hemolysin III family protein [bacterium]MDL1874790.1 hemolysin III family protein [Cytophagia bacterium CHB2]NUM78304.1 hemolysin III family protein [candidate division KSB1 bacterium]
MNAMPALPRYSVAEEIANSVTHGLGVLFSIAGLAILTAFASLFGTVWHVVSCSIYGATQIFMYTASTLYHSIPLPRAKAVLRQFDHAAIFLLIAGTYTPFALVNLRGPWGWTILTVIWGFAILGIVLQTWLMRRSRLVATIPYLAMGWMAVIAIKPLLETVAPGGLLLLMCGGLAYTVGTIFYISRRLRFHHAFWHAFVLAGSMLHFFAILFYVIPLAS